jgi:hypothetical protein
MRYMILVLTMLAAWCPGVEFALTDKTKVTCDDLSMMKETPTTLIIAKTGTSTNSYKFSQIDISSLPAALRDEFTKYQADQLQKRIILKNDKWIHRDEMLLEADPRYSFERPLAKIGDSLIDFINNTDQTVTIGIRWGVQGYEMHIDKKKKRGFQVPDGALYYILVQESPDGTQLVIQKSDVVQLKRTQYTVTIVKSDEVSQKLLSYIPIPKEYQVAP